MAPPAAPTPAPIRAPFLGSPAAAPMAAPLPAPTTVPVIVPQAVITIASSDNPTITAKARNAALVEPFCLVFMCVIPPSFQASPPPFRALRRQAECAHGVAVPPAGLLQSRRESRQSARPCPPPQPSREHQQPVQQ